jgi:hypothetical protein
LPDKDAEKFSGGNLSADGVLSGALNNRVLNLINEFPGVQRKILVEKLGEGFAQPLGYLFL